MICLTDQAVEKRRRGSQNKAEIGEKRSVFVIHEHFEPIFNAVFVSLIVMQRAFKADKTPDKEVLPHHYQ